MPDKGSPASKAVSKAIPKRSLTSIEPPHFDYGLLMLENPKSLKRALKGVLTDVKPHVRACATEVLRGLASGKTHKRALADAGIPWGAFSSLTASYPLFAGIYGVAQGIQAVVLKHAREDALQTRAVEGWEEPVWYKGVQVGTIRRFSDKLLVTALKASDPDTYGDKPALNISGESIGISFVSIGVDHSGPRATNNGETPAIIDVSDEATHE